MTFPLSRLMSSATAGYAVFALAKPSHLGDAMGASITERSGYDLLAHTFGVRDLAISSFGFLGRSDRTVRTAMGIRILCDVGDGVLLSLRAGDSQTRTKVLGVTMSWAALNLLAVRTDARRAA